MDDAVTVGVGRGVGVQLAVGVIVGVGVHVGVGVRVKVGVMVGKITGVGVMVGVTVGVVLVGSQMLCLGTSSRGGLSAVFRSMTLTSVPSTSSR